MHDACVVQCTPEQGRFVMAQESIPCGTVIMQEEPSALVFNAGAMPHNCSYCCSGIIDLEHQIICDRCNWAVYCSEECRRKDAPAHRLECLAARKLSQQMLQDADCRALLRLLAQRLDLSVDLELDPQQKPFLAENMVVNRESVHPDRMEDHGRCVLAIAEALDLNEMVKPEEIDEWLEWCIDMLCRFGCNGFTIRPDLGFAVYPQSSLFNHSCAPNCSFERVGRTQVIRAVQDIPSGTEVTLSYTPLVWPTSVRHPHLESIYFFPCGCPRCTAKPPCKVDRVLELLLCSECRGPMMKRGGHYWCMRNAQQHRQASVSKRQLESLWEYLMEQDLILDVSDPHEYAQENALLVHRMLTHVQPFYASLHSMHASLALFYRIIARCFLLAFRHAPPHRYHNDQVILPELEMTPLEGFPMHPVDWSILPRLTTRWMEQRPGVQWETPSPSTPLLGEEEEEGESGGTNWPRLSMGEPPQDPLSRIRPAKLICPFEQLEAFALRWTCPAGHESQECPNGGLALLSVPIALCEMVLTHARACFPEGHSQVKQDVWILDEVRSLCAWLGFRE
eukprot:gnl/Trimastix_PCT/3879.p1 GENE.gnl/Trimastix_PCT/3879~~gnl/Trimastix_PCT/3879.p1  ORF type:complete len:564 (+),score=68.11 gnl/Trimastix_PCT/3879:130-1821(+)